MSAGEPTVAPEAPGARAPGRSPARRLADLFGTPNSPWPAIAFFSPFVAAMLYWCLRQGTPPATFAGALAAGAFAFTLADYFVHRLLFHARARRRWLRDLVLYLHGLHHRDPYELPRAALPLWAMIGVSLTTLGLLWLALGDLEAAMLVNVGFGAGYLAYEVCHYAVHVVHRRGEPWPWWAAPHLSHHFVDARRHFGVTTTIWDRAFGTWAQPARGMPRRG